MKSWMDLHDFDAKVCPHCKFELQWRGHPAWAEEPGAIFALDGVVYRIVSAGWTNGGQYYPHSHAQVRVEPIQAETWMGLPEAPCAKADVGAALKALFQLHAIAVWDLARAIRVVPKEAS